MASNNSNPWAWLGLLKWSLEYSDGTSPSSSSPLSEEDKAFLEAVMKDGIIDENERMKEILQQVTASLEAYKQDESKVAEEELEMTQDLLQELRDIVEQIDYARAFCAMKGLNFLLGCTSQPEVPTSIRCLCLGILATMAQSNPPVQKELLELGALRTLSDVYFANENINFRSKLVQALSASVRSHELAENVFCQVQQAQDIILTGLQVNPESEAFSKRTLFFLRALVTSDTSSLQRVRLFALSLAYVIDNYLQHESSELREMALELLVQILEQKKSVNLILERKNAIVGQGVQAVSSLRALTGEDREMANVELELWESLLLHLSRASPDIEPEPPFAIAEGAGNADPSTLPQ